MKLLQNAPNDEAIWNEKKDGGFMDKTIQFRRNNIRQQIGCFLIKWFRIYNASAQCDDWKHNLVNEQTTSNIIKKYTECCS
jgi:hypothetical protein